MSQTTNGNSESLKVDDAINQSDALLAQYEQQVGLPPQAVVEDATKYMQLTQQELRKLSPIECDEASYILTRSAIHIQREINKYKGRVADAQLKLDFYVAKKVDSCGTQYTPYASRKILAIKDDGYAIELQKVIYASQQRLQRLEYLPTQIQALATALRQLAQSKRSEK